MIHVCSHKEMFNSLVAKEKGTVKIVDDLTCEVISIRIVNVTCRDGMMHTLEAVRYIPEARYNLIFIGVLDEEECWIQVQQSVITVANDTE